MADVKITDLAALAPPALTDVVPVVDLAGPTTKKATLASIRAAFVPIVLSADASGTLPVANGGTGVTTSTGTGATVRGTSPTLSDPVVNGQTQGAAVAVAALEIDWAASPVHTKTLAAGSSTFTFANAASGMVISVRLTADAGGSTVTWPTMKWAGDAAPTFTASKATVVTLMHDGTTIIGVAAAEYTP